MNVYRCSECGRYRVCENVDEGFTPSYLACPAEECEGTGVSMGYPNQGEIPDKIRAAVRWEWYKPGRAEIRKLSPEMKKHVGKGGLLLREKV